MLDASGKMVLHEAWSNRQLTVVKLLLKYGVNMDARRRIEWSRLHEAVLDGHLDQLVVGSVC